MKTLLPLLLLVPVVVGQVDNPSSCEEAYHEVMTSTWLSESDKQLARFEYRICGRKDLHELEIFDVADGVDAFEAWYLATRFRVETYGGCGLCGMPTRSGTVWEIEFAYGGDAKKGPLITVDAATGVVRCEGHAGIMDPMALIRKVLAERRQAYSKPPLTKEERFQLIRQEAAEHNLAIEEALRRNAERQQAAAHEPSP